MNILISYSKLINNGRATECQYKFCASPSSLLHFVILLDGRKACVVQGAHFSRGAPTSLPLVGIKACSVPHSTDSPWYERMAYSASVYKLSESDKRYSAGPESCLKGIIDSSHTCLGSNKSCLGERQREKACCGMNSTLRIMKCAHRASPSPRYNRGAGDDWQV